MLSRRPCIRILAAIIASILGSLPLPAGEDAGTAALEALRRRLEEHAYDEILAGARALLETSEGQPALAARVLDLMADTYRRAGRAADPEGRGLAERAIRLKIETAGPDHPSVADSLTLLANLLSHAGELEEAAGAHRRALAIREKALGPDHEDVAASLDGLGDVLQKQARYEEAQDAYRRALAIGEEIHGPDHLKVADTLYDMGNLGIRMGDYKAARARYDRALRIYTAQREPGHLSISMTKITLGYLLNLTGDLPGARSLLEEAVAETSKSLGTDHPLTAMALNNLGTVLFALDDYEAARPIFAQVLESRERSYGEDHPETADAALNLGAALRETGRSAEALPLYERALAVYTSKLGSDHPRVAMVLANMANASFEAGKTDDAVRMYRRSLEIRLAAVGRSHPDTARSHELLAGALLASGNRAEALVHASEAALLLNRHTRETVAFLPERQALMMRARIEKPEALLFQGLLQDDASRGRWLRACWDWSLRSRALVLDELARRNRTVLTEEEGPARRAWDELAAARQAVADLWVEGPGAVDGDFDDALDRARARKEELELGMARLSAEYGQERMARTAGLDEVRAALPRSSALVGYARVEVGMPTDRERPERYFALVLPREGDLRFADLGPAREVDRKVEAWRTALDEAGRALAKGSREESLLLEVTSEGRRLREAIWDPVAALLVPAESVFIVPDGLLHNVDFQALPAEGDRYLIEVEPEVHLLDAERDLVRLASSEHAGRSGAGGALLVGDPAFGAPAPSAQVERSRNGEASCDPRQGTRWSELPESAREVVTVGRLLGRGSATILTKGEASEARFKREAPGKKVLHLATHGFFLHGRCEKDAATMNPLLLSGLLLAGANESSAVAGEDGYLTSEELGTMDLRGLDLAVLSACDTGRGRIESGEGVLGLRRSLALAGARTVVMSLWRVPDSESRRWMTSFYESLAQGESIRESVRSAGLSNLERLRRRGIPPHPHLWAGFVAAGDWR